MLDELFDSLAGAGLDGLDDEDDDEDDDASAFAGSLAAGLPDERESVR